MIPDESVLLGTAALGGAGKHNPPRATNHIVCELELSTHGGRT